MLRDYFLGGHNVYIERIQKDYGKEFLDEGQLEEAMRLENLSPDQLDQFLTEHAGPKIVEFWYFIISLSRKLFSGENPLSASDAYWIGAIDEVIGTNLYGMRLVAESEAETAQLI